MASGASRWSQALTRRTCRSTSIRASTARRQSQRRRPTSIAIRGRGQAASGQSIRLRNFDQSNVATGVNGTLTGTHAHIENVLAGKLPFAQAAKGTWHFRINDQANFEARTDEQNNFGPNSEPAEHQDEVSQYFYINSLLEYVDYLHVAGDAAHHHGFGQGD